MVDADELINELRSSFLCFCKDTRDSIIVSTSKDKLVYCLERAQKIFSKLPSSYACSFEYPMFGPLLNTFCSSEYSISDPAVCYSIMMTVAEYSKSNTPNNIYTDKKASEWCSYNLSVIIAKLWKTVRSTDHYTKQQEYGLIRIACESGVKRASTTQILDELKNLNIDQLVKTLDSTKFVTGQEQAIENILLNLASATGNFSGNMIDFVTKLVEKLSSSGMYWSVFSESAVFSNLLGTQYIFSLDANTQFSMWKNCIQFREKVLVQLILSCSPSSALLSTTTLVGLNQGSILSTASRQKSIISQSQGQSQSQRLRLSHKPARLSSSLVPLLRKITESGPGLALFLDDIASLLVQFNNTKLVAAFSLVAEHFKVGDQLSLLQTTVFPCSLQIHQFLDASRQNSISSCYKYLNILKLHFFVNSNAKSNANAKDGTRFDNNLVLKTWLVFLISSKKLFVTITKNLLEIVHVANPTAEMAIKQVKCLDLVAFLFEPIGNVLTQAQVKAKYVEHCIANTGGDPNTIFADFCSQSHIC